MKEIIIKVGGGQAINWDYICEDIVSLIKERKIIIVHGASAKRDEVGKQLGLPTKTVISPSGITSVYTDKKALEVFLMVYCGLVNKEIVIKLQGKGINAVGLSGIDGKLWQAKRKKDILIAEKGKIKLLRDNYTGRVEKINSKFIQLLLRNNYLPVICPPAVSFENEIVNTDNDWATAVMAGALGIKELVILFEAPGLLRNVNDENSVVHHINKSKLDNCLNFAQGRMKKKVLGAKKAFELGIKKIYWGDGRIKHPIINALKGKGTIIS